MHEAVIKFYRRLLKNGFEHIGSIENPSIFLDSVTEKIPVCGQVGRDYLQLFIDVRQGIIQEITYMCTCDPTTNVGVEIMCTLVKGKTLTEIKSLTEKDFGHYLGCEDKEFLDKSRELLKLLNRGINRFGESSGNVQISERN